MTDFWAMSIPRRISDVIFLHIGAWDMIGAFHMVYFTQGHTPFGRWWFFLGIAVPRRCLDSFHIGVRDMIGWFLLYDHESMAFSSLLTFFEMIGSGHGHLWEHAVEFSHSRVCPILGHNPFIGGWSQRHQFTSRHALSLEEIRYSLHITTMTLRSRDSFRSDDVWLVVLLSSTFDLEILTLGHGPLVLVMILWDDSLCWILTFQRSFCIESLPILRLCIHTRA